MGALGPPVGSWPAGVGASRLLVLQISSSSSSRSRLRLSAAFALPSGGPKLLPGLSLSKGACSGSQCAAVNTALHTAQISPSLIELPSTQRVPPEDLIFQGRTRSGEAEKKSVIFPLACDVRAAQLSVTDASLGTWRISRADADAPPGRPGGSELPESGCLVMKVAARALTSDTDTDGGRWALPLQMSRKRLVKQKGGVGQAAPERDCQRSRKYSSARPGPAPSLFQGNLTKGTSDSQIGNVIKKNRRLWRLRGCLVPESHPKPALGSCASLEEWLGFRVPRPHPLDPAGV